MVWRSWILGVIFLAASLVAFAGSLSGQFSEELDTDLYDCLLTVQPPAKVPAKSAVRLALEWESNKNYLAVTITGKTIQLAYIDKGRKAASYEVDSLVKPGESYALTIMRRGSWLGLLSQDRLIFRGEIPRAPGKLAGIEADRGWKVDETRIQRLEPVVFADNFMRTADESGGWATASGQWALQSAWDLDCHGNENKFSNTMYAQNPFAWVGRGTDSQSALCTTGKSFWEDYTITTAVRPTARGAIGVAVNMTDARNGLIIRWAPANDRGTRGNTLALLKLTDGTTTVLKEVPGGYIPGQWYRLAVKSNLGSIQVEIDGRPVLQANDVTPWRGGVGLYAEGTLGQVFDDITVYGQTLNADLLYETQQSQINQRFRVDTNGMQEWSIAINDWTAFPGIPYHRLNKYDYFGDHWMSLTVRPSISKTGQLWLVLNGDKQDALAGYRLVMQAAGDPAKLTYTLFRDTKALATKTTALLTPNVDYVFRFHHEGNRVWLEQDGDTVLEITDKTPLPGLRPSYRAEGCFAATRDVVVTGRNVLDYSFSEAPVDWEGDGTWMPTIRWSCAPHWSFLGGWSRGDAVLWHKTRFNGDQYFEAYLGLKMEYPRERDIYDNRYHTFSITICGDGHNPRSGYTGIFGAPGADGTPNKRTVLMRNGVVVASTPEGTTIMPGRGAAHREWFDLALNKRGKLVELYVEGRLALAYLDPDPIEGGVPAMWNSDNGMNIARARIFHANPPVPRDEYEVAIDDPWYPEWGNVGQPLTLDFPNTWAASGKPIRLQVEQKEAPAGGETTPAVTYGDAGPRLTFTPKTIGEYWYQIVATDGKEQSPHVQLALPTFDPALKRDDSRALVLYRFDEGKGKTVIDHSTVEPRCDLSVIDPDKVHWLPGQGLRLTAPTMLMTPKSAGKLMAISRSGACTLELWVSTDTIYPPSGWIGCLLAWETTPTNRNFAVGHHTNNLIFAPTGCRMHPGDTGNSVVWGFRTSLQHLVITWDGKMTRSYANGKKLGEKAIAWRTAQWSPDNVLLLGNQSTDAQTGEQRDYLGTYYLVAIHDRCMSDDEVLKNYQAGPSAQ